MVGGAGSPSPGRTNLSFWKPQRAGLRTGSVGTDGCIGSMSMDKPGFARNSAPARASHTGGGDFSRRPATAASEDDHLDEIKSAVLAKLALDLGKDASVATDRDWFVAAALTIRDRIVHRWLAVDRTSHAQGRKRVYYLSLEFLIGRLFADVLCNLGWTETF